MGGRRRRQRDRGLRAHAKDHPLFSLPNVTFTPHSAGPTWENWAARFRNGFDNIQRVAAGRAPKWTVFEMK